MRHLLPLAAILALSLAPAVAVDISATRPAATTAAPQIAAASAILTDAVTGQVLYERKARVRRPIASTTKIMTAILVIERCGMDDVVTASENATKAPFTSLHLRRGEEVRVKDLLYAMFVRSANDAAIALAEHVGGSVKGFAKMMNEKAHEIGAKDTHFINPNGLYVPHHYSTAWDLALIARCALQYPVFNEIAGTTSKQIDRSVNREDLVLVSRSKFLRDYQGADGIKSGYTKEAGYCYVGSARRNGWRLLSAALKSTDSGADTVALMDYGFSNFEKVVLAKPEEAIARVPIKGGKTELEVVPERELHVAVRLGEAGTATAKQEIDQVHAPVKKGDKVGTVTAYVGGRRITSVGLRAAQDVEESLASMAWPWLRSIGLLGMISIGAAYGRAAAKDPGGGRGGIS